MVIVVFVSLLFIYSLISHRLERTVITAPVVFCSAGILLSLVPAVIAEVKTDRETFLKIAEIALVLVLFTDATRVNLRTLRSKERLPLRLLGIGMPLTILLGAIGAALLFPQLSIWEAGILAAVLAPTDASLGEVVVNSQRVPVRIRQSLFVEAGLNDGLAVPFLMLFIDVAHRGAEGATQILIRLGLEQVGLGTVIGILVGFVGGRLLDKAGRRGWVADSFRQLGIITLPVLCLLSAEPIGGSVFIAAFVAGLAVQVGYKDAPERAVDFSQNWGQLLNVFVFFLFGLIVGMASWHFSWLVALYAVLSLTVVRMVPVAISLIGTRLSAATVSFMGWFGPRGLASIVLGLVFLEQEIHLPGEPILRMAMMMTVLISIFAHGLSASPGIRLYAQRLSKQPPDAPELKASPEPQHR